MYGEPMKSSLSHAVLKDKQRRLRDGFPLSLGLRVHRAISWLGRAEREMDDPDLRFILLWISFNSAYASEIGPTSGGERGAFARYFKAIVALDGGLRIDKLLWDRFPHEIRVLLNNRNVYAPFWAWHNGTPGYENWEKWLARDLRVVNLALRSRDTAGVLSLLFERLYVLRNQLVHGGATWNGAVNRDQVRDGAAILGNLVPVFIDLMMDDPARDWGAPFYPVVEG